MLQVGYSAVSGRFPESYSKLRKLDAIWMQFNQLTGTIPEEIVQLSNLGTLTLSHNLLTGSIPKFPSNHEMKHIILEFNMLTGSIPESLFSPSLIWLYLSSNQLSGSLPREFGKMKEVVNVLAEGNQLSGSIPSEISELIKVENVILNSNIFTGSLPSELGLLARLELLDLQDNRISGSIPTELSSLSAKAVYLQSNNITGNADAFCSQDALLTAVGADCGGLNPQVNCPCCTICCIDGSEPLPGAQCETQIENVCRLTGSTFTNERGLHHIDGAGTNCECIGSGNQTTLSCSDTQCQSCNLDLTVCTINEEYSFEFDILGDPVHYVSTFQHVVGGNYTVKFENTKLDELEWACEVSVNSMKCNSCFQRMCVDGFLSYEVNCDNLGFGFVTTMAP